MKHATNQQSEKNNKAFDAIIPAISHEQLLKTKKILFVAQLAIGDFAYLQNQFAAFKEAYPWITIDLWVDDLRRTWFFWRWKSLQKYVLYDWVDEAGLFGTVYKDSYAWPYFYKAIKRARAEEYPLVVYLGMLNQHRFIKYVRQMAPRGFVAALTHPTKRYWGYRKLDARISFDLNEEKKVKHISEIFAGWFEKLFGLRVPPAKRLPFIHLSNTWKSYGKLKLVQWGVCEKNNKKSPVVFLNCFAKSHKRTWKLENLVELVIRLQKEIPSLLAAKFVINAMPEDVILVENELKQRGLCDVEIFTAHENFFQLPAVMSCVDLVISVDTSIVHLATALHKPLVVLMREKQIEWKPLDKSKTRVLIARNGGRVNDIAIDDVIKETSELTTALAANSFAEL